MAHWKDRLQLFAASFTEKLQYMSKSSATRLLGLVQCFSGVFVGTVRKLHTGVRIIEPWTIFLVAVGVLVSIFAFLSDLESRVSDREFRSWQTVHNFETLLLQRESHNDDRLLVGRGLRQALEFLNKQSTGVSCITQSGNELRPWLSPLWYARHLTSDPERSCILPPRKTRTPLSGLRVSGAMLQRAQLPDAILERTEFSRTDLSYSNLSGANLFRAQFQDGIFIDTDFSNSCLLAADFSGAMLVDADFSGAYLVGVNFADSKLKNADFSGAFITDHFVVHSMLKYIEKQNELGIVNKGLFPKMIGKFEEFIESVEFFAVEEILRNSTFQTKCAHIIPSKLEHFSSRFFVGLFAEKINMDIEENLRGANFKGVSGLDVKQFQEVACPSSPKLVTTPHYSPKNLPVGIQWDKKRCESPNLVNG